MKLADWLPDVGAEDGAQSEAGCWGDARRLALRLRHAGLGQYGIRPGAGSPAGLHRAEGAALILLLRTICIADCIDLIWRLSSCRSFSSTSASGAPSGNVSEV